MEPDLMANGETFPPVTPEDPGWIQNPGTTANPDGTTITTEAYQPATEEEKAAMLGVDFATPITEGPDEPYPLDDPIGEEEAFIKLTRIHSPMELVPSDEYQTAAEKNLAAGGSVDLDELRRLRNAL
jgi:hypothetical protein